jgi:hypothetical protein
LERKRSSLPQVPEHALASGFKPIGVTEVNNHMILYDFMQFALDKNRDYAINAGHFPELVWDLLCREENR